VPELVEDGVTGTLVPPGDVDALSLAIGRLAAAPDVRASYGRAGRDRVRERFDSGDVARRMIEVYEKTCASST
jgi:glycosyltransferase involved in cell wall biosynthesis